MPNKEWSCLASCPALCCGPFPMDYDFWIKFRDKAKKCELRYTFDKVYPLSEKCPFLGDDNKCVVYSDRPKVCRDFGLDPKLPCPFLKPNGNPRSDAGRKKILRLAKKTVFRHFNISQNDIKHY